MSYYQPYQVIGFHGCEKSVGLDVLSGRTNLFPSNNSWDWLGNGIYFWENNPIRGLQYAEKCANGTQKNKTGINEPFVIGAIIELGNCLDFLEPSPIGVVKQAYNDLIKICANSDKRLPSNKENIRKLDCAVIEYLHKARKQYLPGSFPYDTVRCAFPEGDPIYKDSNFTERSHIELCVINPSMIKGYFLPHPIDKYNPFLNKK